MVVPPRRSPRSNRPERASAWSAAPVPSSGASRAASTGQKLASSEKCLPHLGQSFMAPLRVAGYRSPLEIDQPREIVRDSGGQMQPRGVCTRTVGGPPLTLPALAARNVGSNGVEYQGHSREAQEPSPVDGSTPQEHAGSEVDAVRGRAVRGSRRARQAGPARDEFDSPSLARASHPAAAKASTASSRPKSGLDQRRHLRLDLELAALLERALAIARVDREPDDVDRAGIAAGSDSA